jgi:hypothetical protein
MSTRHRLWVIEIDRLNQTDPGRPELECLGFVGPEGGPPRVRSAHAARRYDLATGQETVEQLRASYDGLIVRLIPETEQRPVAVTV